MKLLLASVFLLMLSLSIWAATPAGQVILTTGELKAINANNVSRSLQRGTAFYQDDTLTTGSAAQAKLRFTDGTLLTLNPNSRLRIDSYRYQNGASNNNYIVNLTTGGFRTVSGAIAKDNTADYQVHTPVATIAIRGTDYSIMFSNTEGLTTAVWQGAIELSNDSGKLLVGEAQKFQYAQIKAADAIPEGLTQMPKALISGAPPSTTVEPTSASSSAEKDSLLEICIP